MNYKIKRDSYNLKILRHCKFSGTWGIPVVTPTQVIPTKLVAFNECFEIRKPEEYFVHFYIDDYQFERIWNFPQRYLNVLQRFAGVIAPDFSLYLDIPPAMQIYNHFRNQALSSFYQHNGITVIPNISWSNAKSFDFCFDGLPNQSVVAISTNGTINAVSKQHFLAGYREMIKRLKPSKVIIYGKVPSELENKQNTLHFASRLEKLKN